MSMDWFKETIAGKSENPISNGKIWFSCKLSLKPIQYGIPIPYSWNVKMEIGSETTNTLLVLLLATFPVCVTRLACLVVVTWEQVIH